MKSDINIKPKFSQNGSFRSLSFNNGSSLDHPQVSSIPHNSCFLVNGKERKLSNSYLRFQRRYSKHGWVTLTRWQFTGCSIWKMTKWKRCRNEIVHLWIHVGKAKMSLQGVPHRFLTFIQLITLKVCIFDSMLAKPKCVWEVFTFIWKLQTNCWKIEIHRFSSNFSNW